MRVSWRKQAGATLIELVLVFSIATILFYIGFRVYSQLSRANAIDRIQYDVDRLFQATALYYQAGCRNLSTTPNPKPLVITTDLVTPGYLANWQLITNTIVDNTTWAVQLQNNSISHIPGATYNDWVTTSPPYSISYSPTSTGNVIVWAIHIGVKLQTGLDPTTYRNRLGATCTASAITTQCSTNPASGQYLIWERLPVFTSSDKDSNFWVSLPRVKAFTNLYYTDDMYNAYSGGTTTNNYLCGT